MGQEQLLTQAAETWRINEIQFDDVLDVGCGLGGGSIFWAQEYGARVTAVTIAPSHLYWVKKFAKDAQVDSLVEPLLCDASEVPGDSCFDVAVAVESSCHFPRSPWFRRLGSLLRSGGYALVADYFVNDANDGESINQHWHAQMGTLGEYRSAASDAGLYEEIIEDISHSTENFWTTTGAFIRAQAKGKDTSATESSLRMHAVMRQAMEEGSVRYLLVSFRKH